MSRYILLVCKRLLIVTLIVTLSWFTLFTVFPFVDDRTPVIVAIVLTYLFLAYIGLPTLLRVYHALHKPTHVPTRTHAADGWALDPINLVVLAKNEKEFTRAMLKAGWIQPDPLNLHSTVKTIGAVLFRRPYPRAPFSNTYIFGKKQDLAFQIQIDESLQHRHHVRFWRLGKTALKEHEHASFWQKLLVKFIRKETEIWIGAVSMESGINITRRSLQITHRQHGDTDASRDFLVSSLVTAGVSKDALQIKAGEPLHTRYQGFREKIIADGYVTLCEIKRQFLPQIQTKQK
ncbi:MAG TPA: LssY C-terminal domain-containing protein [Magnetospirillaceae bacterium]|nr:LssY C-terminal domain-containing protein [Magnetospirillaceae bacterium]